MAILQGSASLHGTGTFTSASTVTNFSIIRSSTIAVRWVQPYPADRSWVLPYTPHVVIQQITSSLTGSGAFLSDSVVTNPSIIRPPIIQFQWRQPYPPERSWLSLPIPSGTAPQQISAYFAGTGSFASHESLELIGSATFIGNGTFNSSAFGIESATSTFSGVGFLTLNSFALHIASSTFLGAGTLLVDTIRVSRGDIVFAFTGSGSLLANPTTNAIQALFAGSGALSVHPMVLTDQGGPRGFTADKVLPLSDLITMGPLRSVPLIRVI